MTDDVEAKLARLEARLGELQAEMSGAPGAAGPPPPAPPPAPPQTQGQGQGQGPAPAPTPTPRAAPSEPDHLEQFGLELRRLSHDLVAAYDRVLEHERRAGRAQHRVVLEVQADLQALAALQRALDASPGVRAVELRAYAGGHASLVVDLA